MSLYTFIFLYKLLCLKPCPTLSYSLHTNTFSIQNFSERSFGILPLNQHDQNRMNRAEKELKQHSLWRESLKHEIINCEVYFQINTIKTERTEQNKNSSSFLYRENRSICKPCKEIQQCFNIINFSFL